MRTLISKTFSRWPAGARAKSPTMVASLIVVGMSLVIVKNAAFLLRTPAAPEPSPTPALAGAINPAATAAMSISAIAALNLFGKIPAEVAPLDASALPLTALNLKISGIFMSTRAGYSRSLIAEEGKPAKPYAEGDVLPGGATLYRIENDCVIVQRGDQFEKLALRPASIAQVSPRPQPPSPTQIAAVLPNSSTAQALSPGVSQAPPAIANTPGAQTASTVQTAPPGYYPVVAAAAPPPVSAAVAAEQLQTLRAQMDARIAAIRNTRK